MNKYIHTCIAAKCSYFNQEISEDEEAVIAERAASPPQSVIDQRTLEAYKVCWDFISFYQNRTNLFN